MSLRAQLPVIAAAIGSSFGGTAAVAARILAPEAGPTTVSLMRYLGLLLLLLAGMLLLRLRLPRVARADWPMLISMGVLQFGLFGWFFSAGFTYVSAARGAIMLATMPMQTLLLAALLGRERFTLRKLAGMVIGVAGVAVALWSDDAAASAEAWKGDLFLLAAAFVTALNSVMVGPFLVRYSVHSVSLIATFVGCVLLGTLSVATGSYVELGQLSARGWAAIVYFAAVPTFLGLITWTWALKRVAPTRVTVTVVLNPIAAAIAGAWYLGEPLDPRILAGLALVTIAIVVVNWPARDVARRS
jgi:drug/metabolite transporter (DMT)-like permease